MKTNMTERDKKLLVGMLIGVLIVAIGYWGIIPQLKAYNDLESKIETEEQTQKLNKLKISNTSLIQMQADDYEKKLAEVKDEFYPILTSADVDQMLTEMATKRNLYIYELDFKISTIPTERMAYVNSELFIQQDAMISAYKDAVKQAEKAAAAEKKAKEKGTTANATSSKKATSDLMNTIMGAGEGGYQPNTQIYAVPVTITVGGEIGALENFLKDVENMDRTTLLTSYTWGEYRSYEIRDANGNLVSTQVNKTEQPVNTADETGVSRVQVPVDTTVRKTLTINLEIYMIDTSDVASTDEDPDADAAEESEDETKSEDESPESLLEKTSK